MLRRKFLKHVFFTAAGLCIPLKVAYAKQYLTIDQAKEILFPNKKLIETTVELTKAQKKSIQKSSTIRVRNLTINAWKTKEGDWFILDQILGKHEFIDLAVAISKNGDVTGVEVLTYRETYGDQIMHPKWRAQFYGTNVKQFLKLDKQIKNISGATLSCRHVTDGVNRLNHTWHQVLQYHT